MLLTSNCKKTPKYVASLRAKEKGGIILGLDISIRIKHIRTLIWDSKALKARLRRIYLRSLGG